MGADALAAGGKRLRPLLAFLCAPPDADPPVAAGAAVELVHMATLVHDDLIDGAKVRRGKAAAWAAHGAGAAQATGDYLFARAFAELAAEGDIGPVAVLADACLCLARGEAMQRRQLHDPDTTVDAYLERCSLKTGKLFEAACSLGSGGTLGRFGLNLGIAFQIADDILDCSGDTIETGKVAGTDLREGTPTLPLLLAAKEDEVVRAALAGGPGRRRARPRCGDRRARTLPRGRARLRWSSAGKPRRRPPPGGARDPRRRCRQQEALVLLPAIHAGFCLAITRRERPPAPLRRLPACAADACGLSLGARDPEARRHYWKEH